MMIHEITEMAGRNKRRKRIGRGHGSGHGKTSGRGHKGAGSRSGFNGSTASRATREGGQNPWYARLAKIGFSNAQFRTDYSVVNIRSLDARFEDGAEINPDSLVRAGLIRDTKLPVKILAHGETTKRFVITAAKFSGAARDKIAAAGGTATEAE